MSSRTRPDNSLATITACTIGSLILGLALGAWYVRDTHLAILPTLGGGVLMAICLWLSVNRSSPKVWLVLIGASMIGLGSLVGGFAAY